MADMVTNFQEPFVAYEVTDVTHEPRAVRSRIGDCPIKLAADAEVGDASKAVNQNRLGNVLIKAVNPGPIEPTVSIGQTEFLLRQESAVDCEVAIHRSSQRTAELESSSNIYVRIL